MELKKYHQQGENWKKIAAEAWEYSRLRKLYEKSEARAFAELKELSNHSPSTAGDFIFDYHKSKGSIDYQSIPELQNLDLEKYRKDIVIKWKLEKIIKITTIA